MQKREKTWEQFLFWSSFKTEKDEQTQKRQLDKDQSLIKKLKKKVTVKYEEAGEPGKSSNQEDENIELGQ